MKAILTFQGFTESEHARSGTEDLFFEVIRKFACDDVTTYHPRTWSFNETAPVKARKFAYRHRLAFAKRASMRPRL